MNTLKLKKHLFSNQSLSATVFILKKCITYSHVYKYFLFKCKIIESRKRDMYSGDLVHYFAIIKFSFQMPMLIQFKKKYKKLHIYRYYKYKNIKVLKS